MKCTTLIVTNRNLRTQTANAPCEFEVNYPEAFPFPKYIQLESIVIDNSAVSSSSPRGYVLCCDIINMNRSSYLGPRNINGLYFMYIPATVGVTVYSLPDSVMVPLNSSPEERLSRITFSITDLDGKLVTFQNPNTQLFAVQIKLWQDVDR